MNESEKKNEMKETKREREERERKESHFHFRISNVQHSTITSQLSLEEKPYSIYFLLPFLLYSHDKKKRIDMFIQWSCYRAIWSVIIKCKWITCVESKSTTTNCGNIVTHENAKKNYFYFHALERLILIINFFFCFFPSFLFRF